MPTVPRAPGRLPILGHALAMRRHPLKFLRSLPDYGDVVRVDLGTMPVYFVTTPELAHELLVSRARHFDKGRFFERMRALTGDGLATAPADLHRRHRRLVQPAFGQRHLARYATIMSDRARALVSSWRPGQRLDIARVMSDLAIGTLTETMFSTEIARPSAEAINRDLPIIFRNLTRRAIMPRFLDRVPVPANRRFAAATRRLRTVLDEVIATAHRSRDGDDTDLLSLLLAARDDETGEGLSDREVRDELITFLTAGTETVSSTMAWACYEISRHPDVEQALLDELDAVLGAGPVTFDDLPKLVYTRQVIDETLRLRSVPLLMRRAVTPVELGGIPVPAGTEVAFSLYTMHRDPRYYPEPNRFDPNRHLRDRDRGTYLPFGAGTRKCIGDTFATTEAVITLATIFSRWHLQRIPSQATKNVNAAMARPDTVPMTVLER